MSGLKKNAIPPLEKVQSDGETDAPITTDSSAAVRGNDDEKKEGPSVKTEIKAPKRKTRRSRLHKKAKALLDKKKKESVEAKKEELFCICRVPYDPKDSKIWWECDNYGACAGEQWYHRDCEGETAKKKPVHWICTECRLHKPVLVGCVFVTGKPQRFRVTKGMMNLSMFHAMKSDDLLGIYRTAVEKHIGAKVHWRHFQMGVINNPKKYSVSERRELTPATLYENEFSSTMIDTAEFYLKFLDQKCEECRECDAALRALIVQDMDEEKKKKKHKGYMDKESANFEIESILDRRDELLKKNKDRAADKSDGGRQRQRRHSGQRSSGRRSRRRSRTRSRTRSRGRSWSRSRSRARRAHSRGRKRSRSRGRSRSRHGGDEGDNEEESN